MGTYITNIGLLATPRGHSARRGAQQGDVTLLRNAWVELCGETIAAVGQGTPAPAEGDRVIDAGGRLVTPGLVDAHTHLIFGGWRQNELGQKLRGVPYLDILAQGGGILSTVRATRAATEEQLAQKAAEALAEMLRMGVTTCEAKSGYGLDPEQEMKQLRVIRRLKETQPVELAATFMGAHALPEEYRGRREAYIRLLCQEMIPRAAREGLAEFCDVFCETGVFTAEESRTILEAGLRHGLRPKVHADEIDAIGRARGKNAGFSGNDERENTLNQLLTEMDGFQTNTGVIVLAATNRADILDKALMRAGRFDRQIEVGLPDVKEREEIFNVHLRPLKLDPQLDRSFLARQTPGFSGADIANVCNEAALIAARHNKKFISKEDFLAAIDRIVGGLERKNKIITDEEKRVIAFHEAGHATVSWILEHASPLIKVTIIPRGKALGAAWYLPEERQITTREQMMDELAATLGGRVSEQLTFGEISTGALNDLERVTKQAYAMVAYYGMSENVGTLSFYDSTGQSDMAFTKPYSELTAQQIDAEAKQVIEKAYKMAEKVLREHADGLKELAELLLSREVVFTEDVERIFGRRKKDIERERREAEAKAKAEGGKPAGEEPQAGKQAAAVADPSVKSDKSETAEPAPVAPAVAAPETE